MPARIWRIRARPRSLEDLVQAAGVIACLNLDATSPRPSETLRPFSRSVERIVSVPMLDEVASDINAASSVEDGLVPEKGIVPLLQGADAPLPERIKGADAPLPEHKSKPSLDLKLQRADAFFASPSFEGGNDVSRVDEPPAAPSLSVPPIDARSSSDGARSAAVRPSASKGGRILRYGGGAAAIACLCGLAWAAGSHQFLGRSPGDPARRGAELQHNPQLDALAATVRQISQELRVLEARLDAKDAKAPSSSAQPTTGKDVADLSGRFDELDARLTAKLSHIDEQLAGLEQRGTASRATEVSRAQPTRHHAKHVHDAFDPSRDPNAPGAPRPLGSR